MMNQLTKERREAYVEVLEVLKHMERKYVAQIPIELREFFERNASREYKFNIDPSKPLEEYELKENTINILAMLNINYWCEDEGHKEELLKKYYENDKRKEEALRKKYNPDNLFNKKNKLTPKLKIQNQPIVPMETKEESWYKKAYNYLLRVIKRIFNKQ